MRASSESFPGFTGAAGRGVENLTNLGEISKGLACAVLESGLMGRVAFHGPV